MNKDYFYLRKSLLVSGLVVFLLTVSFAQVEAAEGDLASPVIYEVKPGDNLSWIASKYNLTVEELVTANKIDDPDLIRIGSRLFIPVKSRVYIIQKGDNLWEIARKFSTTVDRLVAMNNITQPNLIMPGDKLSIPYAGEMVVNRSLSRSVLFWPTKGVISSGFGERWGSFHEGLDIAGNIGTPIYAAAAGKVDYVGEAPGYGQMIRIIHRGEMITIYGHCERMLVRTGQYVSQGQLIALMGSTGRSTGTHLHFEVRINGTPKDPLQWLPWGYLET